MRARDFALLQLDAKHLPGWPNDVFRQHLAPTDRPGDPRDAALAEHITVGVVKNLLYLRYLIVHFSQRQLDEIEPLLQKILTVAIYQLKFLTRVPASAVVNEGVEQTKRGGRPKAAGFINAVLRRAARDAEIPLPDPIANPVEYAEAALSHPPDLFKRFQQLLDDEKSLQLCRHNNNEPPTIVRLAPNGSRQALNEPHITVTPHQQDGLLIVDGAKQSTLAQWAENGIAQVQDATSAKVVDYCDLKPGQTVLDRCCGLGTKTLQLLERVGPDGRVVGIDPSAARTNALRQLLARRGIHSVAVVQAAMVKNLPPELPQRYDRALLDVPCSNSGVLARRAEARYHQDPATLDSLKKLQTEILEDTAAHVSAQGKLIYSTCSIWPEENQDQIRQFLSLHPEFTLVEEQTTLPSLSEEPSAYHDGGYVAVLERGKASIEQPRPVGEVPARAAVYRNDA